jgi:HK97 family phage major capsid protein
MSAGATGYWVSEGGAVTGSQPTLGQVPGTPHTCGVLTDISRRLLLQSTPAAEQLVRDEITQRIARTVQIAVFQGTGADGQPTAITGATGINNPSVTQGTPTYAELLGFPGNILSDSAAADGQQWVMTGEVWQKLAATFTDGTAKAERVLDWNSKTCLGFPYQVTEDVGANSLFFGNWKTVMVGIWGAGIDLNLDTATLSSSGGLRIVGLQDVDVMVRLGQALAYNAAVTN